HEHTQMSIDNICRNDSNLYEIILINDYEQNQMDETIKIFDRPNDGSLPINSYFVEYRDLRRSQYVRCERLSSRTFNYEFNHLTKGSQYTQYDRSSESVTIKDLYDVPTQQGSIDINELTDTSCILSWKPFIRDNGSSIIEYIIELS
ncbi:unnamed protein product, partial [Rotaria sp. Silwood2]